MARIPTKHFGSGPIKEYELKLSVIDDGSGPYFVPILECTSLSNQDNRSNLTCNTVA